MKKREGGKEGRTEIQKRKRKTLRIHERTRKEIKYRERNKQTEMRFEVLMAVNINIMIFYGVTPCSMVDDTDLLPTSSGYTEDGRSRFLRNVADYHPNYMTSQLKQL